MTYTTTDGTAFRFLWVCEFFWCRKIFGIYFIMFVQSIAALLVALIELGVSKLVGTLRS